MLPYWRNRKTCISCEIPISRGEFSKATTLSPIYNRRSDAAPEALNEASHLESQTWQFVIAGRGPELINGPKFQDFKLPIEFNRGLKSISDVHPRGSYETQIETGCSGESPSHHTGAIYGFWARSPELPRKPPRE